MHSTISKWARHGNCILYVSFIGAPILSLVLKREVEKELRAEQNGIISELTPLVVTVHLPSIKIFYNSVRLEELSSDGQVIGEINQGESDAEDFDPSKWENNSDAAASVKMDTKAEE